MLFDFIQQIFLSGLFFLGIAGAGLLVIDSLLLKKENSALRMALAYFFSLCIFTLLCVFGLFIFTDKLGFVAYFTYGYFFVSAIIFGRRLFEGRKITEILKARYVWVLSAFLLAIAFLFFLQIYHTSILDEWLHRPVVNSFVHNGVFPLVNPVSADQDFIYTYHYGVHIIGASLALIFGAETSESLDLFKLANFIGAFLLFYGLLRKWLVSSYWALLSAGATIFVGSSFFLMDTFTTSHLKKIGSLGADWPSNVSLSFGLTGVTSVGALLFFAFFFTFTDVIKNWKKFRLIVPATAGILFSGFMLLGEYYAALALMYMFIFGLVLLWKKMIDFKSALVAIVLFLAVFIPCLHYSGGLGGAMLNSVSSILSAQLSSFSSGVSFSDKAREDELMQAASTTDHGEITASAVMIANKSAFAFKGISQWGYPSEKRILQFFDKPVYYVRSFLLEALALGLMVWLFFKRKLITSLEDKAVLFTALILVGVPFFITTAFGDLNLAKSVAVGLVLFHLYFVKTLYHMEVRYKKYVVALFVVLFFFGSIPGMVLGSNIQWQWVSSKGRAQYCSQNPLCYEGSLTALLESFERQYPGLKKVAVDRNNTKKVIDLTQSYVYPFGDNRVEYIVDTAELRKSLKDVEREELSSLEAVLERDGNRVLRVK